MLEKEIIHLLVRETSQLLSVLLVTPIDYVMRVFWDRLLELTVHHLLPSISTTPPTPISSQWENMAPQELLHSPILFRDGIFPLRLFLLDCI